ncbi:MAG: hypothetical protein ACRCYR_03750 [Phycicoccus sp.]
MSGKFTPRPRLDEAVARMIAPKITEAARDVVAPLARSLAPPSKTWVNSGDDRVREPHVTASGQTVAGNVRFKLTAFEWDIQHPGAAHGAGGATGDGSGWSGPRGRTVPGMHSYLLEPRDPTGGAFVQVVHCRCQAVMDPEGVSRTVGVRDAVAAGTKVTAYVYAEGELAMQAEHGDIYPFPVSEPVADGTRFMHRAASLAANTLRARQ